MQTLFVPKFASRQITHSSSGWKQPALPGWDLDIPALVIHVLPVLHVLICRHLEPERERPSRLRKSSEVPAGGFNFTLHQTKKQQVTQGTLMLLPWSGNICQDPEACWSRWSGLALTGYLVVGGDTSGQRKQWAR